MEYIRFQQEENNRRERDRAEERRLEQERWDKLITLQSKLAIDQETKQARETEEKTKLAEESEAARLLREEERLRKLTLAQNLPKFDSHKEDLHTFLQRFENIMNYEKVLVEEWVAYRTKIITGKDSILLTTQLTPDILASYHKTRDALLDSVGLSYHHYAELFFHPSKSWDATPESVHHGTVSALTVILRGAKSLDDAKWIITRLQVLMQYTPECLHHVMKFKPEGPAELFLLIHSYEEMHGNTTRLRYKKRQRSPQPYQQLFDSKISYQEPARTNEANTRASPKEQHREMDDIVCYSCGKTGYNIAQCPAKSANTLLKTIKKEKVYKIATPSIPALANTFDGKIQNQNAQIYIDTGAAITLVKASRVPKKFYTGEYVHIAGYGVEQGDVYPTACITLDVRPFQFVKKVAVVPDNSMQRTLFSIYLSAAWR